MERGKRLVIWIPEDELWIWDAIEVIQRRAEKKGVPFSQGDIVRMLLLPELAKYMKVDDAESEINPTKGSKNGSSSNTTPMDIAGD